jgi:hypothetical protein
MQTCMQTAGNLVCVCCFVACRYVAAVTPSKADTSTQVSTVCSCGCALQMGCMAAGHVNRADTKSDFCCRAVCL